MEVQFLVNLFLNLEEEESYENDHNSFEKLLHFEAATIILKSTKRTK